MLRPCLLGVALALAAAAPCSAQSSVQASVVQSTSVQVDVAVDVEVHVETVETVEPAEVVEVVVVEPAPVAEPAPGDLAPVLLARGAFMLGGARYDVGAWGGAAGIGLRFDPEWSAALVAGYLAELAGDRSELDLGVEITRDFAPESDVGFLLVGAFGTAFGADAETSFGDAVSVFAQLGVGARMSFDPRIALALDLRGVLQYVPPSISDGGSVSGGMLLTMGLQIRLD